MPPHVWECSIACAIWCLADPDAVHARGGDGQTPLHFAATAEIATFLLDRGAQIDALDIDHESTPAQWMIRDRQEVVRLLIARGCRTDILMAAALGDIERVTARLDADPSSIRTEVSDRYFPKKNPRAGGSIYIWTLGAHKTAHHVARDFGHSELFALLMKRSPAALALAVACEVGDEPMMHSLSADHPAIPEEDRARVVAAAFANNARRCACSSRRGGRAMRHVRVATPRFTGRAGTAMSR